MDERLTNVENRLTVVEEDLQKLRQSNHDIKNEQQVMVGQIAVLQESATAIQQDTAHIKQFIDGTDKLFGFCRKHWRTILKFGCGFVTAYGVSNPKVGHTIAFVTHFFGL